MLYYSLSTLDELDATEAKEAKKVAARDYEIPAPSLGSFDPLGLGELNPAF